MSVNPSCPTALPEGIVRNSTEFVGPNATTPVFAGYVYEWDSLAPTNSTMNVMLSCCSNTVYIGEHQPPTPPGTDTVAYGASLIDTCTTWRVRRNPGRSVQ